MYLATNIFDIHHCGLMKTTSISLQKQSMSKQCILMSMIVAVDKKGGISKEGKLPWRFAEDMNFFRKNTTSEDPSKMNVVIMGKNTWATIPKKYRGLQNRLNIIVSTSLTQKEINEQNATQSICYVASSLSSALSMLRYIFPKTIMFPEKRTIDMGEIFICGGSKLYEEAFNSGMVDKVYAAEIDHDFQCDNIIWSLWKWINSDGSRDYEPTILKEVVTTDDNSGNSIAIKFMMYDKKYACFAEK